MDLSQLIEALSDPAAYPGPVEVVEVRQTHISAVFLAGPHVYKVKKPVEFGFLDFSTPARRRHFCEEEVRLNRHLAPDVYLGVVAITRGAAGVRVEGDGEVIDWAVKMRRLPEEATLQERLRRGEVGVEVVEALARKIASFHAHAESGPHIAAFGRFAAVAGNARENFEQAAAHVGTTVDRAVFARVQALDASDANWSIYQQAVKTWEEPGPRTRSPLRTISTSGSVGDAVLRAVAVLRLWGLCG